MTERNTLLGEAIALSADVHRKQFDKANVTYFLHPFEVMQRATDYYLANSDGWQLEKVQAAAVLHDSLEDIEGENTWDRSRLSDRIYELDNRVWTAVDALTKYPALYDRTDEGYQKYLEVVSRDWIARIVKIADLSHNMDGFRIPSSKITEKDFARWDKYHRSLVFLLRTEATVR